MRARKVRETIGILMISAGLSTLIAVGYQLFFTNVTAHQEAKKNTDSIIKHWAATPTATATDVEPNYASGFALIYIPKLSNGSWEIPIAQGVATPQLNSGYGHYQQSAMPGEVGNFAIAAHRATHGEPLAHVDKLVQGDKVFIRTREFWYTYELDKDKIVLPEDIWVVDKDPNNISKEVSSDKLITLTTCNPRYGSTQRWIWWGHLLSKTPASEIPTEVTNVGNVTSVAP